MKRLVVAEHCAHEYANRLWSDMSIYALSLSTGARVYRLAALEHVRYIRPFHWLAARLVDRITRKRCGLWALGSPKSLPPSEALPEKYATCNTLYFFGWLFRNPVGFAQYREKLLQRFAPSKRLQRKATRALAPLKDKILIGIHLKYLPFKGFEDGAFLVSPLRVAEILEEYIRTKGIKEENVALVIIADTKIPDDSFQKYNTVSCVDTGAFGFSLLSTCTAIIGTNSTYANLAAWFANAPHIVTKDEPIDWRHYQDKTQYFENKYADFTFGQYDARTSQKTS